LVEKFKLNSSSEKIVVCSHPPVVTLGRGTKKEDVFGWKGDIFEVQRGGRATYHGPGQLVAYPILDLNLRGRDLHRYFRLLEGSIVGALKEFGLESEGRESATGVWIGDRKIASLGIAVKKWVSYHGLAINLEKDPMAFQGINPCGFSTSTMVSLRELRPEYDRGQFQSCLIRHLQNDLTPTNCN
jgi:lipoate-protein ligase B